MSIFDMTGISSRADRPLNLLLQWRIIPQEDGERTRAAPDTRTERASHP